MGLIKSFFVAFAMYSKIPVPRVEWKKENMQYALTFFPLIGLIIGALNLAWFSYAFDRAGEIARICVGLIIPLVVTGGIHIDGYMDVMDALHSYGDREKKLNIMKDPHVGAFAVINLLIYYLLFAAGYSQIYHFRMMGIVSAGFYLSRILSGLFAVSYKSASGKGMLFEFTSKARLGAVRISLVLQLIICGAIILFLDIITGGAVLIANAILFVYVYSLCAKEFGGINGDSCGFLSSIVELVTVLVVGMIALYAGTK
ncbi:MAG: adenosylcobinamide-GDP ribazoletransferase [Lachnospiraceae bacterium]|nr:adenosylcobinamide-GDP ribazoletransferase [Lachnospiraceae bacterium]